MTHSIKIIAAAVLFSTAAIGGAMAQQSPSNQGDYYKGVDPHNNNYSGDMLIYPNVDGTRTGSIARDTQKPYPTQDGAYYEGATQPMQDPAAN